MKLRGGAVLFAGALLAAAALVAPAVSEGRGGGPGPGGRGRCGQTQAQCQQQNANCPQDRQCWRGGSGRNPDCRRQGSPADCPGPCGSGQGAADKNPATDAK